MEEKIQVSTEVSRRYGKALFDMAKEKSLVQNMFQEVIGLLETFKSNQHKNHGQGQCNI